MDIFVGNIPFSANADEMRQLFGRFRGFGFVEMLDENEANAAIEAMHGTDMAGRSLTVNEARPREPR